MFAAFGLDFRIFLVSALLSTPKLLLPVYIGYLLEEAATARKSESLPQFHCAKELVSISFYNKRLSYPER